MINCHYLGPYHLISAHSMLSKIVPRSRVTVRSALLNTADVYLNGAFCPWTHCVNVLLYINNGFRINSFTQ